MRKVPRSENAADVLTHPPSAAELQKFLPKLGLFPAAAARGAYELVKAIAARTPAASARVAAALLPFLVEGASPPANEEEDDFWRKFVVVLIVGLLTIVGLVTSLRTFSLIVCHCACCQRRYHDRGCQTDGIAWKLPAMVWVSRAGERYHLDGKCSGFTLFPKTPCGLCIPRG